MRVREAFLNSGQRLATTGRLTLAEIDFIPTYFGYNNCALYLRNFDSIKEADSKFGGTAWAGEGPSVKAAVGGTTADLNTSWHIATSGTTLNFAVNNLFDVNSPHTSPAFFNVNYDPANADARGRILSLQVREKW